MRRVELSEETVESVKAVFARIVQVEALRANGLQPQKSARVLSDLANTAADLLHGDLERARSEEPPAEEPRRVCGCETERWRWHQDNGRWQRSAMVYLKAPLPFVCPYCQWTLSSDGVATPPAEAPAPAAEETCETCVDDMRGECPHYPTEGCTCRSLKGSPHGCCLYSERGPLSMGSAAVNAQCRQQCPVRALRADADAQRERAGKAEAYLAAYRMELPTFREAMTKALDTLTDSEKRASSLEARLVEAERQLREEHNRRVDLERTHDLQVQDFERQRDEARSLAETRKHEREGYQAAAEAAQAKLKGCFMLPEGLAREAAAAILRAVAVTCEVDYRATSMQYLRAQELRRIADSIADGVPEGMLITPAQVRAALTFAGAGSDDELGVLLWSKKLGIPPEWMTPEVPSE